LAFRLCLPRRARRGVLENGERENAMGVVATERRIDPGPARRIVQEMSPVESSDIIPLLQKLQAAYGYVPREIVLQVCEETGLPASRLFGVATFYEQFHLEPRGRHLVRCCRGTACHVKNGKNIIGAIERTLGIAEGGTTPDRRFTFETVACLGTCFLAPVIMVDDDYIGQVTPAKIEKILERYK
jgi:NADH:ubiquinone oxidoreductase subunit E